MLIELLLPAVLLPSFPAYCGSTSKPDMDGMATATVQQKAVKE